MAAQFEAPCFFFFPCGEPFFLLPVRANMTFCKTATAFIQKKKNQQKKKSKERLPRLRPASTLQTPSLGAIYEVGMHCTTPAYFGSGAKLPSESDTRTSLNLVLVGKVGKVGQTRALDFLFGARRRLALSVPKYVVPLLPARPASTWPLRTRPRPGPVGSRGEGQRGE